MRVLGGIIVCLILFVGGPMLWERAMIARVNDISANQAGIPVGKPVEFNYEASANLVNAINQPVEINTEEYEQLAAKSAADDAIRQAQAAQDQAWRASHGQMP